MNFQKYKEEYFLIILSLFSLINTQNLCPYKELQDLLQYYTKGINPSKCENCSNYKWEYIHCVNQFYNSTYFLKYDKDPYFYENSGILIGSSINLGKLKEDFIKNNLTELSVDKSELIKLIGKFGEEAESINEKLSLNFTKRDVNYINEKVYEKYLIEMKDFFGLDKGLSKIYGFSFELNLLTFFVKYYGMEKYLLEAKKCLESGDLFLLSYYFLNLKSDNYVEQKLRSMVTLSSDEYINNNNIRQIGIYYDTKLHNNYHDQFSKFLLSFIQIFDFEEYYYTLGNITKLISKDYSKRNDFFHIVEKYNFTSNYSGEENITKGIENFKYFFDVPIPTIQYFQEHLIIFINDIHNLKEKINIDYFKDEGIQVILFVKISHKSDEEILKDKFEDYFNIITFYDYSELISGKEYVMMLRNLINYNIHNHNYIPNEDIIIENIYSYGKNNRQNFKITFDQDLIPQNTDDNDILYFHISLIYNNAEIIEKQYKNNANITFLVSGKNPYADILNYDIVNFCFNTTVSSYRNKAPFINYIISNQQHNYFYISIMSNDIRYSLDISLESSISQNIPSSNGYYENGNIIIKIEQLMATFSDKCIERQCSVDYFSLLKYYSSGIHFSKAQDDFNKIIDMNMIKCLYKNVFCPFYEIKNSQPPEVKYNLGPLIGYGLNISNYTSAQYYKQSIPLYLINKMSPFLDYKLNMSDGGKTLVEKYNLFLTYEETDIVNTNYLYNIFKDLEDNHKKFKNLNSNLKLSIFLRVLEQHLTSDKIDKYLDDLDNNQIDKYLNNLMNSERNYMSTQETLDFQMMMAQTKKILQPKKCLLSIVIGKSLLWSDEFYDLISKIDNYRISITYYDSETEKVELFENFNEDIEEIKDKINELKKEYSPQKTENVDINAVLQQQKKLFKYYDEGIKKCIVIISTRDEDIYFKYEFNKPDPALLEELYDLGITIFDYSDQINFILDEIDDDNSDIFGFFNSTKSPFIQYVPFLNFSDMNQNVVTLTNIINRFPIPVNKIEDLYLDMEGDEEIVYEFNLKKEITKIWNVSDYSKYNRIKLSFETNDLHIYFSDRFIFPNNYSNHMKHIVKEENNTIFYELRDMNSTNFYMSIQTSKRIDYSVVNVELCDKEDHCLKSDFYFKFYLAFIITGVLVLFYGIYICFCDNAFKKEGNIFEMK